MDAEINIHQVLKVFQKVVKYGTQTGEKNRLEGITAESDFDGYTIVLSDGKVSLTVFFHNKYQLDSPNQFSTNEFFEKIRLIETKDYENN